MARHPNQTNGYNRPLGPNSKPSEVNAAHDKSTAARDLDMLATMSAKLPKKPPHRHVYIKSLCTVCGQSQVEST